ncbi:RNA polymerase sigma factor [Neobacillus niacini]|uniref:RNA polymerase sigma factor n=1 Tax=Neobacillus niacini TaxID=86668 RepID=UPI0027D7C282|nr:sigma factor [Neobacillus niacini]
MDGSDHAFRLLVEKYRNDVFRTVFAVLRDQKEAEDAAQEVFMKIYSSLSQYENQGFKTWMTVNGSFPVFHLYFRYFTSWNLFVPDSDYLVLQLF